MLYFDVKRSKKTARNCFIDLIVQIKHTAVIIHDSVYIECNKMHTFLQSAVNASA